MPNPIARIDYQRHNAEKCDSAACVGSLECPNQVLRQEALYEFPFSHPSHFCKGCGICVQVCPLEAIRIV
jgi:Pyruvate/2-oxoacid:ferredoxin oxidoreductase delta subunit